MGQSSRGAHRNHLGRTRHDGRKSASIEGGVTYRSALGRRHVVGRTNDAGRADVPAQRSPRPAHRVRGIFGTETIESLLLDSYAGLAATATVTRWLAPEPSGSPGSGSGPSPTPTPLPAESCPPSCSCACITPGAHRWRSAGSPTWQETGLLPGRAGRRQPLD